MRMTEMDLATTLRIEALRAATKVDVPGHMTTEGRAAEFVAFLASPGHVAPYSACSTAQGWGECVLADGHEDHEFGEVGQGPVATHVDRWGRHWGVGTGA